MDDGSLCPPVEHGIGKTHIRAVQHIFKWLLAALAFAAWNVSTGDWNKGTMTAYLRTCAVAKSVRERVWVKNHLGASQATEDEEVDSVEDSDGEECEQLNNFTPNYNRPLS